MPDHDLPFRADENALIKFGDPGTAPVLNYNVPQPAEYNGRHYLEIEIDEKVWTEVARHREAVATQSRELAEARSNLAVIRRAAESRKMGVRDLIGDPLTAEEFILDDGAAVSLTALARRFKAEEFSVAEAIDRGGKPTVKRRFGGETEIVVTIPGPKPNPRLAIITSVRMSSYLGDYGAARTINTFSLLPGESHEISIKSFKRTKTSRSESASILDSHDTQTEQEFGEDLTQESSSRSKESEAFSAKASIEGGASWGFGSVKASASVSTSSASEREEFAKSVASTTQKHAAKAASKRQMEVNTTSNEETEESEERSLVRTIKNINVGRTLNFVFRQMVQRYLTVVWVTDVRLAYHNDDPDSYREIALPDFEDFMAEFVVPGERKAMRKAVHDALFYNFDWRGDHRPLVEEVKFAADGNEAPLIQDAEAPDAYWRFRRHKTELKGEEDGANVTIPGPVLAVVGSTLPTEGVIVEALLGQGNALDAYSLGLQSEAVRARTAENDLAQGEIRADAARLKAVEDGDATRADLLAALFPAEAEDE